MPEFLFHHNQNPASLYTPFYQYFLSRWNQAGIPEYDLETDELIHRDGLGSEVKRERFDRRGAETGIVAEAESSESAGVFDLKPSKGIPLPAFLSRKFLDRLIS
jgi:hypothetical protein